MEQIEDLTKYYRENGEPEEVVRMRNLITESFADLEFFEEGHRYVRHMKDGTDLELPSVSGVTHKFSPPFEEIPISENYALKHGNTPEYWRDVWKMNNLVATTSGTLTHEYGESVAWLKLNRPDKICDSCKPGYIKDKGWLIPTRNKEKAILKFWCDMPECYHVILPEARIYNFDGIQQPYAGTFDLGIYYRNDKNPSKSGFILMDYKTNGDLYNEYNATHNKRLLGGFSDMIDCSFSMYVLQLNLYQRAIENIGIPVIDRRLIWLKDDCTYELVKVPDIQDRIPLNF